MGLKRYGAAMLMAAIQANPSALIDRAVESYKGVESYSVTLRTSEAGRGEASEVIRYYYKRPGLVRMEFVKPHKGAVLVYDSKKREARLRPFPSIKSFILTLSPDNWLIKSSKGHSVDRSDMGALLDNARRLRDGGAVEALGDEGVGGRPAVKVVVRGAPGSSVDGVNSYALWLESVSLLPLRASSFDPVGGLIEDVIMDDLDVNPPLADGLFSLD